MDRNTLKPLLISADLYVKQAMQKLNATGKKILFVVNSEKKLFGTITDGDIRRGIINGLGFNDKVEKIMYRDFISVSTSDPEKKEHAKQLMIKHEIEQIPVLNEIGIIEDVILWTDMFEDKEEGIQKTLHHNQVIIMAGGKGTRLDPFTKVLPKPLIPIGNKPVIELIMEKFYRSGFSRFIYTLNYKKEYIKLYLKEIEFPYSIDWVEEDSFLGTAGSLSLLKGKVDDTFFLVNCDSLIDIDFEEILKWHKDYSASLTIVGCHNEITIPFGVLELSNGKLEKILEKPVHDVIINTGVYVVEPRIISYIPENEHLDMNMLIELVANKEKITVYPISSGWFDIGQWKEYRKNLELIKKR